MIGDRAYAQSAPLFGLLMDRPRYLDFYELSSDAVKVYPGTQEMLAFQEGPSRLLDSICEYLGCAITS